MDRTPDPVASRICARGLRAAGVAMWTATVPVVFLEFHDRYQNPAALGRGWPWGSLWPPALAVLLALAAPWIARRFRWRDDAPPSPPGATTSAPVRLRPAWLLAAVAASGAALVALLVTTNAFGRTLAHGLGWSGLAVGAAVPLGVIGFGLARSTSADVLREPLVLAVLRAGGVFGLVCTFAGAGRFFDDLLGFFSVGGEIYEHHVPHFVELVLGPVTWLTWMVIVVRGFRDHRHPRAAARPRHVLAAVAATMAVALVAPTVALVEGWRWRTEMYARATAERRVAREQRNARAARSPADSSSAPEVVDFDPILFLDDLPDPAGFARRAWTTTAGFAGFVLVAAIAGRRGRGDARPGGR